VSQHLSKAIHPRVIERRLARRGFVALLRHVCEQHHATAIEVLGQCRRANVVAARRELWSTMCTKGLSMREVGRIFGRNESGVFYLLSGSTSTIIAKKGTLEERVAKLEAQVAELEARFSCGI
jgi:hypothetical protein